MSTSEVYSRVEVALFEGSGPRIVVVSGPAGSGKSHLLGELRRRHPDGFLAGTCISTAADDLHAIKDAIATAMRDRGGGSRSAAARKVGRAAYEVLPDAAGTLLPPVGVLIKFGQKLKDGSGSDPAKGPFDGLLASLKAAAGSPAFVLALDDAHLADQATVDFLMYWLRRDDANQVRALLLKRSTEEVRAVDLALGEYALSGDVAEVVLHGLSVDEVEALVAVRVPGLLGARDLAEIVARRTGGLPLYVNAAIDFLLVEGAIEDTSDGPCVDLRRAQSLTLPSLSRHYDARIKSLPQQQRDLLETAAVEGERFHPDILVQVVGGSEVQAYRALRQLRGAGDWLTGATESTDDLGEVDAFYHSILRDHIYSALLPGERRAIHSDYADLIASLLSLPNERKDELLAHHLTMAGREDAALPHALAAAQLDLASDVFDLSWARLKPLVKPPEGGGPSDAQILAARALAGMGRAHEAAEMLGTIREDDGAALLALRAEIAHLRGDYGSAEDLIHRAIAASPVPHFLTRQVHYMRFTRVMDARARADELLPQVTSWGTGDREAFQYVVAANIDCLIGRLADARAVLEPLAGSGERATTRAGAYRRLADLALFEGRRDDAEEFAHAGELAAASCGSRQRLYLLLTRAELMGSLGRNTDAYRLAKYAHRLAEASGNTIWQAHSRLCAGRFAPPDERLILLKEAEERYTAIRHPWGVLSVRFERAQPRVDLAELEAEARGMGLITLADSIHSGEARSPLWT